MFCHLNQVHMLASMDRHLRYTHCEYHHHQQLSILKSAFFCVTCLMEASGQHSSGASQRRKQRRMRSWWRHEQVSIAAAVATALHHSSYRGGGVVRRPTGTKDSGNREGEVHEKHVVPREQKRPLPGTRPEPLEEVPEPQVGAVTVGYVAAPGPLLSAPVLADTLADAVDQNTVTYLLQAALVKKMLDILRRFRADLPVSDAECEAWQAWRGVPSAPPPLG